jgi:hypothetical protein
LDPHPIPEQFLPTSVRKSYFMLSDAERTVFNKLSRNISPAVFRAFFQSRTSSTINSETRAFIPDSDPVSLQKALRVAGIRTRSFSTDAGTPDAR